MRVSLSFRCIASVFWRRSRGVFCRNLVFRVLVVLILRGRCVLGVVGGRGSGVDLRGCVYRLYLV